jgi:hypothetical protein
VASASQPPATLLLVVYALISAYYVVALYAVWMRPRLQKFWLLRPRWRHGLRASRFGLTTQAAFAFSLSAAGASKLLNAPFAPALMWVLPVAAMFGIVGWIVDAASGSE